MAASMAPAILIARKPYPFSRKTYPRRSPIGSSSKRSVTIASSSSSFRNGSPPETECPVPWDQQPVNEYQALSTSFPFSLAAEDLRDYCIRLSFLGSSFAILVGLPVATFGNSAVANTSAVALRSGLGAASAGILFVMLVVLRMYLGWAYVGNRLLSATVDYEETGWYDGQIWAKTPEVLARDRLLGSYSEIESAVFALPPNRSPRLDGITASFFKHYWAIVSKEVYDAILEFFTTGCMNPEWKDTLVVLIPKTSNADFPSKFRPISLCQTIYKVAVTIILEKLKPFLPLCIDEQQVAFVPGRSISGHCLLAQELMERFRKSNAKEGYRGFRHGCPLSPYLFILCSDLLSKAIVQIGGDELGVPLRPKGSKISHLLYADDILLFSVSKTPHLKRLKDILSNYCNWTGQRINASKSMVLFSKNTPRWKQYKFSNMLGLNRVNSFDYLGLTCSTSRIRFSDFSKVISKAMNLVFTWGSKLLSLAGRNSLIKSSLATLIYYHLAHTKIPLAVLYKIEKICRSFLWQDKEDHRGAHYVSWKKICLPQEQGGLGINSLKLWSGPLRARLAWNFLQYPNLWHNCLLRELYGSSLDVIAKGLGRSWQILQEGWRSLKGAIRWKLSNGANVSILNDVWILDRRLSVWPSFYNVSIDVSDKVDDLLEDGCWKEDVLLELFGPCLAELIREVHIFHELEEDKPELIFSTFSKSVTNQAFKSMFNNSDERFDWLRNVKLMPREYMFWWRSIHDAIPTQAWLVQKGLEVLENCIWGCLVKEDLHHIMYHCKFSLDVYYALEGWGFPLPSLIKLNPLERNRGLNFSQTDSLFLKSVYQIWINRNNKKHGKHWVSPSLVAAYVLGNFNLVNFLFFGSNGTLLGYIRLVKPVLTKVKFTLIGLAISLAVCVMILVDVENPKYIPVNTREKMIAGVYNDEAARSFEPDAFCGDPDLS
ncbi:hypothetical protein M5K25_021023 [Dendrobium thyrsiflorum]|uniref:Reverse transcriptase domain-containing protein n=1 Tax=Dendrobium thyrsiflorum TaxID=117978 RepID=A0ABD0UC67_DENTH